MTETISTRNDRAPQASFFKRYLKYSLSTNKVYLLMSLICSAMSVLVYVTLFSIWESKPHFLNGTGIKLFTIVEFANFFAFAAIWGQFVLCITGGIRCFQHLTRKNKTDTLMCLPLTHSDRFWGDLLTGYITTAAPLIPCGLLGLIAPAIAQETNKMATGLFQFVLVFNGTVFFVMTFAYLLSVLAASLCGNRAGGNVTAVLLAVLSAGIPAAWGEYFIANIIGYPMFEKLAFHPQSLVPSFTLISEFNNFINLLYFGRGFDLHDFQVSDYSAGNPLNIVFYVLLSLGIVALSYLISQKRKCEHTGEIFAAKHAATVITILTAFAMTGALSYWLYQADIIVPIISAIVVSAVIFLAAELILRRGVKKLGRRVIVYAVSTAVSVGFSVLISATYALGTSFFIPSADKIQSVEYTRGEYNPHTKQYDVSYKFDQKPDIEKFRESHAALLNEHIDFLRNDYYQYNGNPDSVTVRYTLESGETYLRIYVTKYDLNLDSNLLRSNEAKTALKALPKALEDYPPQYAAPLLSEKIRGSEISLGGSFGIYRIYPGNLSEFSRILHDDIVSRYSPDLLPIGSVTLFMEENDRSFEILETYENTLEFIKNNAEFIDDTAFTFKFSFNENDLLIHLTNEDMATPAGKELMALMKSCHPSDFVTRSSEECQTGIHVSSPDYFYWYIPQSNMPQATALITQIAATRI